MKSIAVVFKIPGKSAEYHYLVPEDDIPEIGDLVVTSISWDTCGPSYPGHYSQTAFDDRVKIARVVEIHESASSKATKFYLRLLSKEQIKVQQKVNQDLLQKKKEKEQIKAKLELMLKEQSARDRYSQLASQNPEAAELLKKLEE